MALTSIRHHWRRSVPVTRPDECWTSPLSTLLFLAAGAERSWADPECPATVHTRFLGGQADTRLLMAVTQRHGFLGEELGPVFLADNGIEHGV